MLGVCILSETCPVCSHAGSIFRYVSGAWHTVVWQRLLNDGALKLQHAQRSGALASRHTGRLRLAGLLA